MSERGEVWWGPASHEAGPAYRPWLLVNDESHPFAHTECIGVGMTTTDHAEGIAVPAEAWIAGGSDVESYITSRRSSSGISTTTRAHLPLT